MPLTTLGDTWDDLAREPWAPLLAPLGAFLVLVVVGALADVLEPEPLWLEAVILGVMWGLVPAATLWAGDEVVGRLFRPRGRARAAWLLVYLVVGMLHTAYGSSRGVASGGWSDPLTLAAVVAWPGTAAWLDVGCPLGLLFCPR